jgi:beta-phosphoglucomutase-like phosphatase (HAD superfamily)
MADAELKVIFFDARDTLGEVDRPGHLIPYRPSTEKLLEGMKVLGLTTGVITNLPDNVSSDQGKDMVVQAVLSEDAKTGKTKTIGDFVKREHVVTNHEAGADKPEPAIYMYAANQLKVSVGECLFAGENLIEVLGARRAGMRAQLKPCPPGREFQPALQGKIGAGPRDSGRQFEAFLEQEHLLGERIFTIASRIAEELRKVTAATKAPFELGVNQIPTEVRRAGAHYVYLIEHFADQVHLQAEEAVMEVAVACGMDPESSRWMFEQHEQARAYWKAIVVAWRRLNGRDDRDRWHAAIDMERCCDAFAFLFRSHAVRENDELYPEAGEHFGDADDALVLNLITHSGPSDLTPYVGMVERAEILLGIKH